MASVGVEELEKAKRHCSPGDWTPGEALTRTGTRHSVHGVQHLIEPGQPRCEGSRRTDQRRSREFFSREQFESSLRRRDTRADASEASDWRDPAVDRERAWWCGDGAGIEGGEPPTRGLLRKNR